MQTLCLRRRNNAISIMQNFASESIGERELSGIHLHVAVTV